MEEKEHIYTERERQMYLNAVTTDIYPKVKSHKKLNPEQKTIVHLSIVTRRKPEEITDRNVRKLRKTLFKGVV